MIGRTYLWGVRLDGRATLGTADQSKVDTRFRSVQSNRAAKGERVSYLGSQGSLILTGGRDERTVYEWQLLVFCWLAKFHFPCH